jgi:polyisoprenoid-binding protein YceI
MLKRKIAITVVLAGLTGSTFAASGKYTIDPTHTFPSIEFSHMNISVWRGKFDRTAGTVVIDSAARTGTVDIVVDAASINFGLKEMDEKARSEDFFDVAKYPKAIYKGTLKFNGEVPTAVEGSITLLGVTKPLKLTVNSFNCIEHPMLKKEVCGADVEGEVNWSEYGMKWSKYGEGEAGKTKLRIQVEGIKQ